MKLAYLGPEGSYSHLASLKLNPSARLIAFPDFRAVIGALKNGECDGAVLPIENSLNGAVLANVDLLQNTDGVCAVEETYLTLDHRLATVAGADLSKITRIYSHEQPLAQCAEYLAKNFPKARLIATASTVLSLESVKSPSDGAIVGAHIKREGITLSKENIADGKNNYTQFLLIVRGNVSPDKKSEKIYFSVTCNHASGALLDILEPMRAGGLNMTKIQSRPIKDSAGEYRFFIEVEGDYSLLHVREVLSWVQNQANSFKLIGAY